MDQETICLSCNFNNQPPENSAFRYLIYFVVDQILVLKCNWNKSNSPTSDHDMYKWNLCEIQFSIRAYLWLMYVGDFERRSVWVFTFNRYGTRINWSSSTGWVEWNEFRQWHKLSYESISTILLKRRSMTASSMMTDIEALEKFVLFYFMFSSCSASFETSISKFLARLDALSKNFALCDFQALRVSCRE